MNFRGEVSTKENNYDDLFLNIWNKPSFEGENISKVQGRIKSCRDLNPLEDYYASHYYM